jgi:hypothetical protein
MQGAMAAVQLMPQTREALFKIYASAAQKFKLGRQGDAALEELVEAASGPPVIPGQQQGAQIPPEVQQQMAALQQQVQTLQGAADRNASAERIKQAEIQQRAQEHADKIALQQQQMQQDAAIRGAEADQREREIAVDAQNAADQQEQVALERAHTMMEARNSRAHEIALAERTDANAAADRQLELIALRHKAALEARKIEAQKAIARTRNRNGGAAQ